MYNKIMTTQTNTTETTMTRVEIGHTYYTGNALYPTKKTVQAIITWENLPRRIVKDAIHLSRKHERTEGALWVRSYTPSNLRRCRVSYLPLEVFAETSYRTHEDQITAYTR